MGIVSSLPTKSSIHSLEEAIAVALRSLPGHPKKAKIWDSETRLIVRKRWTRKKRNLSQMLLADDDEVGGLDWRSWLR
jgi:hypothetical protein